MFPVASEISSKLFYPDNFAPLTYDLAEMGEVKNFHGCDLLLICKQSETPESKKFMDFFLTHLLPSLSQFGHFERKIAKGLQCSQKQL